MKYISRNDIIDAIGWALDVTSKPEEDATFWELKKALLKLPYINITQGTFTRCKDCKYLEKDRHGNGEIILWCGFWDDELKYHGMNEYDFCSKGEGR